MAMFEGWIIENHNVIRTPSGRAIIANDTEIHAKTFERLLEHLGGFIGE